MMFLAEEQFSALFRLCFNKPIDREMLAQLVALGLATDGPPAITAAGKARLKLGTDRKDALNTIH